MNEVIEVKLTEIDGRGKGFADGESSFADPQKN